MNDMEKAKKILVIEDNESNMYLISLILKQYGYTVLESRWGEEGIKIAMEKNPALIIVDIQLPGIDGLEVIRRIRASEANVHTPIIVLSAFVLTGDREKALAAGCNGYIEKPINPETIMEEIRQFL